MEALYAKSKQVENVSDLDLKPLVKAIGDTNNLVVSKAAWLAAELRRKELIPFLLDAFERFLSDPFKKDRSCLAKNAIILSVYNLDYIDAPFYRDLIDYRQLEPDGDSAIDVRRIAAAGLAASNDHRAIMDLAILLNDPEAAVRQSVVRTVTTLAPQVAEAALRQKVTAGDKSPEVMDECFRGLMKVNQEESISLVEKYLSTDSFGDYAAFALGESRDLRALEILKQAYKNHLVPKPVLIQAISLVRREEALEFLLQIIQDGTEDVAEKACAAVQSYSESDYEKAKQAFRERF